MHVCSLFILVNRYMSFSCLFVVVVFLIKMDMFWHFLTLFRSIPQSTIIHTDNYIQRNGTEEYPELLAGLHDIYGTGEGIL